LAGWVFFVSKAGRLDTTHEEGTREHTIVKKRLADAREMLMLGNDVQMLTGKPCPWLKLRFEARVHHR
jgi:hypothetical protein